MTDTVFETRFGPVRGRDDSDCIHIARLRYGAAPTGDRRFAPPQPVAPWDGELDCSAAASPIPPQLPSRLAKVMGDFPAEQDEDCLHLDIWTPKGASGLPVLVFLHGGAFMTGGGGLSCYSGGALAARENIVVVNVTYRLGVLGFLPIPGIAPANLGLMDQELALRFIRDHVAAFGGDNANITVCGQSAGAYSIAALMTRDTAPDLFDKAILMSAPLGIAADAPAARQPAAKVLLDALGVAEGDLAAARAAPVEALLKAQVAMLTAQSRQADNVTPPFMPTVDGEFIAHDPVDYLKAGKAAWCPTVLGVTREEHAAFHFQDQAFAANASALLHQRFAEDYPDNTEEALARARAMRNPPDDRAVLIDYGSDKRFVEATFHCADGHVTAGGKAWTYIFAWQSPNAEIAACHCIDLPFLFGNLADWNGAPMLAGADGSEMDAVARSFGGAFAAFASTGAPNGSSGLPWPAYQPSGIALSFDRKITLTVQPPSL